MRLQADEGDTERQALTFSIGTESDEEEVKAGPPPPPIFRHIRDSHPPPNYAHFLVNRFLLRIFPRVLLFAACTLIVVALLPGGWKVALCTADLIPPPSFRVGENITLIGHRGCEFPFPENSMEALLEGANVTRFVELDISLTSDRKIVVMHDSIFNRTTNGTGLVCNLPLSYAKSLELKVPDRDSRGRIAQGRICTKPTLTGSRPCTYRVPTLDEVFNTLPPDTRFMIDVKQCYAPNIQVDAPLCSNCTVLLERLKDVMLHNNVRPDRIILTTSEPASLDVFRKNLKDIDRFALGVDQTYAHYKRSTFLQILEEHNFTDVSMKIELIAIRPDLVRMFRTSRIGHTTNGQLRDVYAWTIKNAFQYKLARCAGISNIIVSEARQIRKRFKPDFGYLLAEAP